MAVGLSRRSLAGASYGQRYRWSGAVLRGSDVLARFDHASGPAPG